MGHDVTSNASLTAFVRELWEAYDRHGIEAMLERVPDDVVWQPVAAGGEPMRTKDELRDFWTRLEAAGGREQAVAYRYEQEGECVLVSGSLRQFGPHGWSDSQPLWVFFFREGRLCRAQGFRSRNDATAAVAAHNSAT
jgi:hypothetical protein